MADKTLTEMPWRGIAKLTAKVGAGVTAAFGVGLTALAAAAVQADRRGKREAERFRWTDKNRWE